MEIATTITRSQAAYVDICYLENDPTEPFIAAKVKIE
ncbi:hypothetical protein INT45_003203, partial [Circinella minor]